MGRPVEHDEATGAALLDAAEQILAEEGPEAVSVRRVANAVNVTTRAVYTVFGNKDGLLAELAVRGYSMLEKLMVEVEHSDDVLEDLVNLGEKGFRGFATSKPHLYRLTFERTPIVVAANPRAVAGATTTLKLLVINMKRGQEKGLIRAGDPVAIALSFHALCIGLSNWELGLKPPPIGTGMGGKLQKEKVEDMWRNALRALMIGFGPGFGPEVQAL